MIIIIIIIIILKETILIKYIITACIPIIITKYFLLFFFTVYKNERKEHKFWQQKYQEKRLTQQKQKNVNIGYIDVNKILVSKKNNMVNIIHLNTLVGIMIMMVLDHYIYNFHKWLAILINLKKIK